MYAIPRDIIILQRQYGGIWELYEDNTEGHNNSKTAIPQDIITLQGQYRGMWKLYKGNIVGYSNCTKVISRDIITLDLWRQWQGICKLYKCNIEGWNYYTKAILRGITTVPCLFDLTAIPPKMGRLYIFNHENHKKYDLSYSH